MEKQEADKVLILMRGVPGSGKSTKAKQLAGIKGLVYSTDDFFIKNGEYEYNPSKIGQYHDKNLQRTVKSMKEGHPLIIIDNTNVKLWEMRKYVEQADIFGYQIRIQKPQTKWAWDAKQCGKKNSHGVPRDKIEMMLDNFQQMQTLDDIRKAQDNRRRNPKAKKY